VICPHRRLADVLPAQPVSVCLVIVK